MHQLRKLFPEWGCKNKILAESVPVFLIDKNNNPKTGEKLGAVNESKALYLPNLTGGAPGIDSYPALLDNTAKNILGALPK